MNDADRIQRLETYVRKLERKLSIRQDREALRIDGELSEWEYTHMVLTDDMGWPDAAAAYATGWLQSIEEAG